MRSYKKSCIWSQIGNHVCKIWAEYHLEDFGLNLKDFGLIKAFVESLLILMFLLWF